MTTVLPPDADWVSRLADETIAEAEKRGTKVVVASGISPSGPVHLGNPVSYTHLTLPTIYSV